jgi:O-acetyl-ADP-ribose deacetylase
VIAYTIPPLRVEVIDGDIAAERVDAVVNAANNHFWMGAGVAGALKTAGGPEIEREAVGQGPVVPGESVVTGGYRLPARYVIHAAVMGQDLRTDAELIERATASALAAAERLAIASVAFPALGTGVGGFPVGECARVMLRSVQAFSPAARSVRTIRFVLFGERSYRKFAEGAAALLGDVPDGPRSTEAS